MVNKVSKIMLGTVQFGMDYGITNKSGKVPYEEARSIIGYAVGEGVNAFDTAPSYGDSEEVLGKIFRDLGVKKKDVFISDKIPPLPEGVPLREACGFIRGSVERSLRKLGFDYMDACLFHSEADYVWLDELMNLKEEGIIGEVGVSVYSTETAREAVENRGASAVQFPLNLIDLRFIRSGVCDKLAERGAAGFARSLFFQGFLLMDEEEIPADLAPLKPVLLALRSLAREAGMTMSELALRYPLGRPGVSSLLLGALSVSQLRENLEHADKGQVGNDISEKIESFVPDFDAGFYETPSIRGEAREGKAQNKD